jgi:hypothetical protein
MTGSIRNSVATFVLNVHSNKLFQNYNFRNCDYYNNLQVSGPLSSTSCHIISVSSIPNTGVFTLASHHISTFYPTVSIVNLFFSLWVLQSSPDNHHSTNDLYTSVYYGLSLCHRPGKPERYHSADPSLGLQLRPGTSLDSLCSITYFYSNRILLYKLRAQSYNACQSIWNCDSLNM